MNFSAVLLCGGESRRMGRDKATLEWRGRPMWQWQLDKLRRLQPRKLYVSARTKPDWLPLDVELVLDTPPARGPASGLAAALARISTHPLLVLAIDLPEMTTEHLRCLCNEASPGIGVVPMVGDRAEPLTALYPEESAAHFASALLDDDISLQSIVWQLVRAGLLIIHAVAPSDFHLYHNANVPADWERC